MSTREQAVRNGDVGVFDDDVAFVTEQIAAGDRAGGRGDRRRRRAENLRPILWRLHFLGGFLAAPIVVSLCLSGILYAWHPQLDDLRFGEVMHRSSDEVNVTLADQVDAARAAHPDWRVHSVVPAHGHDNTAVLMDPPGGEESFDSPDDGVHVYVDPATGQVTGEIADHDTSDEIFRNLHSNWRLGEGFEPFTELGGSWFLVALLTGVYLWWPGLRKRGSAAFALRWRLRGRRQSKEWHTFLGVTLFVPMFFLVLSGLTWTQFAGDRVDTAKGWLSVEALETDPSLGPDGAGNSEMANIDIAHARGVEAALVAPVEIIVPEDDQTGWRALSRDRTFPVERNEIVVNATTGEVTDTIDYRDEHWFNKLRTAAILFHQAQLFGPPLQVFMTLLALSIMTLVIFGYRMWWQRRPAGGFGAPPPIRAWLTNAPISLLAAVVALAWLMPVLALSLVVWLMLEQAGRWARLALGNHPRRPTADNAEHTLSL